MNEREREVFEQLRAWTEARLGRRAVAVAKASAAAPPRIPKTPPPVADPAESAAAERSLADLAATYAACARCGLSKGRTRVVFGQGAPRAAVLVIGEAPGAEEDKQGLAFVGRSGQLLTKMLAAIDLDRERDCYISNVVKCRPPENRNPLPAEMDACDPILSAQIAILRPRVILALGNFAAKRLVGADEGISRLRGRLFRFKGVPVIATFHPAFLLRDPRRKKEAWEDLKRLRRVLDGEEAPDAPAPSAPVAPPAPSPAAVAPPPRTMPLL